MANIASNPVLYVKLGQGGEWEKQCLHEDQTIRLGFNEWSHDACVRGDWVAVRKQSLKIREGRKGAATNDVTQLRHFYEASPETIWITFSENALWWAKAKPGVTVRPDGSRERKVDGKWSCLDANGNVLSNDRLRGSLLSTGGFRGTICTVKEADYVQDKIAGKTSPIALAAETARAALKNAARDLIRGLHPNDFEIFTDLLFREAGWKRLGVLGKTAKNIDLEVMSPITGEKALVQVKSSATKKVFMDYVERLGGAGGMARGFFIVHTPSPSLEELAAETPELDLMGPDRLAELAIDYGLVNWLLEKHA